MQSNNGISAFLQHVMKHNIYAFEVKIQFLIYLSSIHVFK